MTGQQNKVCNLHSPDAASFRELVEWWAESLGHHQIPLHDQTVDINDLLTPDAVHHDLIHAVVRTVYRNNNCGHLGAAVTVGATFTALGRIRVELLASPLADIDQIDLLDSIGWHTRQYFRLKFDLSEQTPADLRDRGYRDSDFSVSGIGAYR